MYSGKQVVRVEHKYKKASIYKIGEEMEERKGTGNYDKNRTQFNVEYVSLNERNLYQEVKKRLSDRNVEYLNKPSTNILNGITFSSGQEFFESLGMKFVNTDRTYKKGEKKGQKIRVTYIKSKDDIPPAVSSYFDSCMEFLKDYVGEENIVLAQIHYDEDTPHLQAYFLPIVDEVERKCYEKDEKGNVIKEEKINKKGNVTLVPKLLRDKLGKIIYEKVKGKFLNDDQFWKQKGGMNSFRNLQNAFNKFINERGFNLDRGEIGSNKEHQTKLQFDIEEKKAELEELQKEKECALSTLNESKNALKMANNSINKEVLNPKKSIMGYNTKDIENMIDYSKNLQQLNIIQENEIKEKDIIINNLSTENDSFKNNKEIKIRNELIDNQKKVISEQKQTIKNKDKEINLLNGIINILNNNIENLKLKLNEEIDKWKNRFWKMCSAIDKLLDKEPSSYADHYEDLANAIKYDYYFNRKHKKKNDIDRSI